MPHRETNLTARAGQGTWAGNLTAARFPVLRERAGTARQSAEGLVRAVLRSDLDMTAAVSVRRGNAARRAWRVSRSDGPRMLSDATNPSGPVTGTEIADAPRIRSPSLIA